MAFVGMYQVDAVASVRSIDQSRGFAKFGKPSYHINAENASTI
jgi:hypothetical protein